MSRRRLLVVAGSLLLLSLTPAPKDPVVVIEAPAKELKLTAVTVPDLSIRLTLENQSKSALTGLEFTPTTFRTAGGDSVDASFDPAGSFDIPAGAQKAVALKVTLLNAGTYTGRVALRRQLPAPPPKKKQKPKPAPPPKTLLRVTIEIARTTASPAMAVGEVLTKERTSSLLRTPLRAPLSMTIYATGAEVKVSRPFLDSVTRKAKADSKAASLVSTATLDVTGVPDPIVVTPGAPTPVNLSLDGLTSPGQYDGTIRFAPAGFSPIAKTFTIYVRDPAWVALLFIILGILLSLAVLIYGSTVRPRLIAQQRVTTFLLMLRDESARASGDPQAESLVATVRRNIMALWDDSQRRRVAIAGDLDVFEQIVPALGSWTKVHKQLRGVRPVKVARDLMPTLDTSAYEFAAPRPDPAAVTTAIASVIKLPDSIRDKISETLAAELKSLNAKLAQYEDESTLEIAAMVQEATEKLDDEDLDEAIRLIDEARLRYTSVIAENLLDRVDRTTPPDSMEQEAWDALKRATTRSATIVSATQDPDIASSRLLAAAGPYVVALSNAIITSAETSLTDAAKKKAVRDAAEAAKAAVAESAADGLNKLDDAARTFQDALGPGKDMGAASDAMASLAATALGAPPGGNAFDVVHSFGYGPPASDLDQPGMVRATRGQIGRTDLVVSAIVVVAACLIGLQVLWIDNLTWGGPASYLAAFVWGFALDQFSHAGVAALRR
jgi:hypothetical protein